MNATQKTLIAAVLCFSCSSWQLALAEQSGKTQRDIKTSPSSVTSADEEIIVHGQEPAQLRLEIQHAQDTFYDRFNAVNGDDQFDIHCREEQVTGSHLSQRVCQPNFWRNLLAQSGEQTTRERQSGGGLYSSYAVAAQQYYVEAEYKRGLFNQKMQKAVTEDPQLQGDLVRLIGLERALDANMNQETTSVQKTAAQETLPYGAAREADVMMGRKPWRHALTTRTFTFAHVYGTISGIVVECRGKSQRRLQFHTGVQWTLPDDWRGCSLRVDAPSGTTFALYEFD